ncbi:DUF1361 domain-containing protein [Pseudofulvibacter geojedonensis]|uniref:DUF1361 domain-containing protein n=1 Tax=Pseudofulvibacter geojedonensis TaxID=1123758 RepID=A0ABW3I5B2_9FLAO
MKTLFTKQNTVVSINIIFCMIIMLLRVKYTQSITYMFLIWNLFLAGIPYAISQLLRINYWVKHKSILLLTSLSIWLLFLPNSPYIITDLIHLNHINSGIIWFDAFLIFLFAANGLLLAILSMVDVYIILKEKWNTTFASISIVIISFLSGFGIYLGRYLRWNSWELFTQPNHLLKDIIISLQNTKAIGVTICMASLLLLLFVSYLHLLHKKNSL